MSYNCNILLGKIIKISGYEGSVTVKLEKYFSEDITQMESVFLEIEGRTVPFFINYHEYGGADLLKLRFDGYESIDKVKEFIGCRVFLTSDMPQQRNEDEAGLLVGYQVLIGGSINLGPVASVIPNNGQWLLNILSPEKGEILIPFHEDFIVSIDKESRIIVMEIPEGLTDIN